MEYVDIVDRRRAFKLPGYASLRDVGFDGNWVTPYQISSANPTGPCLVAFNWLDVPSVRENAETLRELGYLPGILFNRVIGRALEMVQLKRSDLYVTQAFHLLPETRSQGISQNAVNASFDTITRHELSGRRVVALGTAAAQACARFGISHISVPHPSSRGRTIEIKAQIIAEAVAGLGARSGDGCTA